MPLELVHSISDAPRASRRPRPADLAARPDPIPCFDPATGEHLGDVPVTSAEAVRDAVLASRAAQARWSRSSFEQRRRVLGHVLEHVVEHLDELVELVVRDTGKTREAALLELWPVCEQLRHTIARGERWLAPERRSSGLLRHRSAHVEFHPLGVVGLLAPSRDPLGSVLACAGPALMAGNGVVAKLSEWTAWSAARIRRIFDEALDREDVPSRLVHLVTGYAETGEALVRGGVDQLVFVGSLESGRRVAAMAAAIPIPAILELGGKDPLIVCEDAHLEAAVHAAVGGATGSAGQSRFAAERILVFRGIHDAFVERLVEVVSELRQGPPGADHPVDVGAMTVPDQAESVARLVDDAVSRGARALVGGKPVNRQGGGVYFEPTVLVGVTPDMAIAREETRGPVLAVMKVADEDHAVDIANGSAFGRSSSVFTRSPHRARRLAARLRAASVQVNDAGGLGLAPDLPVGGVGASGYGRRGGREGLRAHTLRKAILEDRLAAVPLPSRRAPVKPDDYGRLSSLIRTLYGRGAGAKLRGLRDFLGR